MSMSTTVSNQNRMCVTCDLWGGPRQAMQPYPAVFVTVDPSCKGKCMGGGHNYMDIQSMGTCSKWIKWGVLK